MTSATHSNGPSSVVTTQAAGPGELRHTPAAGPVDRPRPPLVRVEALTKVYEPSPFWLRFLLRSAVTEPVTALDDVSLTLGVGTICAVVGPNGAGKSTLFRVLTGLTTPTSGRVTIGDLDVERDGLAARRVIGFVPSGDQTLYLRLTCAENLRFHGRLHGMSERNLERRVRASLDRVGLGNVADRVGFALSAGMRARLQLARAIMHRPRLLILDEPTAAVDPVGSYELLEHIKDIVREDGASVLLSSHRLEEIESLHDQVVLLYGGRIVYQGDLDVFRDRYSKPHLRLEFSDPAASSSAASLLAALPGIEIVREGGLEVEIITKLALGSVVEALSSGPLARLRAASKEALPLRDLLQEVLSGEPGRVWP